MTRQPTRSPSLAGRPVQSIADGLRPLLSNRKDRLSLGEIVEHVDGDVGLGPVLFVLALVGMLPMPPGFGIILSLPLLVVAPQFVAGRGRIWLPKILARISIKRTMLVKQLQRVLPLVDRVETRARPRLAFLTSRTGVRVVGVACTALAAVVALPIPLAHMVPALAIAVFALGLTLRDGWLVLVGYGLTATTAIMFVLGFDVIVLIVTNLRSMP